LLAFRCSLLSWIGGDGGTDAEWLTDLLNIGDSVLFTVVKRNGSDGWKTIKWSARGFRIGSDRTTLADSYTQTAMSTSEITMRYITPAIVNGVGEGRLCFLEISCGRTICSMCSASI
ncbi:hypothetical protein ANCCAN_29111, partial [Ancylostoma caninum]